MSSEARDTLIREIAKHETMRDGYAKKAYEKIHQAEQRLPEEPYINLWTAATAYGTMARYHQEEATVMQFELRRVGRDRRG
jgi:hypothetical protein